MSGKPNALARTVDVRPTEPSPVLVLKLSGTERTAVELSTWHTPTGELRRFVRLGVQWQAPDGRWLWKKDAGATIPRHQLREFARFLDLAAEALEEAT